MSPYTISTASAICFLLLTITNPTSALPNPHPYPHPQFSTPSNNPSSLFAPDPPSPDTDSLLQNPQSSNNNINSNNDQNNPTSNDLQRARPFRNSNEVEVEFTTAQNIFFTERVTLNERGYGSLALDDVSQVHHNHDGNRITAARISQSPINFPTLECFLRVDGLERDRSLLAVWGDEGINEEFYKGDGRSSSSSSKRDIGATEVSNDEGGYGGAGRNYHDDEYSGSAGSGGNGSRGRIYDDDDDPYWYRSEESEVEKLALQHRYPAIPFSLEPSMYYLASTIHCISR